MARAQRVMAAPAVSGVWDNRAMPGHSKLLSFVLICVVIAAGAATALYLRHPPPLELATGTLLSPARQLPDFNLIDQQGRAFGSADLRGHWSFIFFGYTHCPDFCPTTLTTLAALNKRLRAEHAAVVPQVIFVSVDAKRDTPPQLAKYVPYFDPSFIGLTAPEQATVESFARQMGAAVLLQPAADKDGNYTVDHSAQIFVFDPSGKLTAVLSGPFTIDALRGDLQRIVASGA
jgi:protein SCO1/2